jgi:hypothetical protein
VVGQAEPVDRVHRVGDGDEAVLEAAVGHPPEDDAGDQPAGDGDDGDRMRAGGHEGLRARSPAEGVMVGVLICTRSA